MLLMTTCQVPTHQASDRKWTFRRQHNLGALRREHIYMLLWDPCELRIKSTQ